MRVEVEINTTSEVRNDIFPSSPPPQQHSFAKDRPKRVIRPLQRYAETDLVAYALSIADEIDSMENHPLILMQFVVMIPVSG